MESDLVWPTYLQLLQGRQQPLEATRELEEQEHAYEEPTLSPTGKSEEEMRDLNTVMQ